MKKGKKKKINNYSKKSQYTTKELGRFHWKSLIVKLIKYLNVKLGSVINKNYKHNKVKPRNPWGSQTETRETTLGH